MKNHFNIIDQPEQIRAWIQQADAHLAQNEPDKALPYLVDALNLMPNNLRLMTVTCKTMLESGLECEASLLFDRLQEWESRITTAPMPQTYHELKEKFVDQTVRTVMPQYGNGQQLRHEQSNAHRSGRYRTPQFGSDLPYGRPLDL